jgi:DNA-binding XRE family transcriptional regulator
MSLLCPERSGRAPNETVMISCPCWSERVATTLAAAWKEWGGQRLPLQGTDPVLKLDDRHFLQQVGFRIRELRLARGLPQAQLADSCGLHRTFIGSVERGERNVAILNLRRIAKTLRAPLTDLFNDKRDEK